MAPNPKSIKKRELLEEYNALIVELANMSGDVAKLEIHDNMQASKRVRAGLIRLKNVSLPAFLKKVQEIRLAMKKESTDNSINNN